MLRRVNLGIIAAVLALTFPASASNPTGSADQVLVIPHAGGIAKFGQVDLAQTAATKNQLAAARGGTGLDTSASTGRPKIASGTWSLANIDLTSEVTGALPTANGGTGASTASANQFLAGPTSGGATAPSFRAAVPTDIPAGFVARDFLINGDGGLWQRGTSTTVANATGSYEGDRFYAWNSLGAVGVLTYAQHATTVNQALFDFDVHVSTAPTSGVGFGINLAQSIDNPTSMRLYNQTASFSAQVKAQNHITQVTLALGYVTSEAKHGITSGLPTNIISSQTCAVNTSTYTLCKLENVSMGTSVTTSGSYFSVIYASAQSGGTNVSDLNNGFYSTLLMVNLGANAAPFATAGANAGEELAMAQRFYEKSYDDAVVPGTVVDLGAVEFSPPTLGSGASSEAGGALSFAVHKRVDPTMVNYSTLTGAAGTYDTLNQNGSRSSTVSASVTAAARGSFQYGVTVGTTAAGLTFQWTADAEI